jgi:mono/diheme cytochrome c family protein
MKILKLALLVLVLLVLLAVGTFSVALWMGARKLERTVDVPVVPVPYTQDPQAIKQGKYLFESRGCAECHGSNGGGRVFLDDESAGIYVRTPNLTRGTNSATAAYTEGDWVRAIRHGVSPSGHALMVMPAVDYNRLTDADFAAIVAYVRSLPPVAGEPSLMRLPPPMRALYGLGVIKDGSEKVDHKLPPSAPVAVAANAQHGAYVANMCMGCHGEGLSGGKIPGGPPDWPAASNLTPGDGSVMGRYDTVEKFVAMMHSGKRPDGSGVDKAMPFATLAAVNETDLQAVYAYLKTVPARKAGGR